LSMSKFKAIETFGRLAARAPIQLALKRSSRQ
jgi:hypothetical protein